MLFVGPWAVVGGLSACCDIRLVFFYSPEAEGVRFYRLGFEYIFEVLVVLALLVVSSYLNLDCEELRFISGGFYSCLF